MRRLRRVKIIATLGPASVDRAVVASLAAAGADLFRINMSHTDHASLANYVRMIREIEAELSRAIGVLVDLQGPKLRIGAFAEGSTHLRKGDSWFSISIRRRATPIASACRIPRSWLR